MKRLALFFSLACLPFLGIADLPKHKKPKASKDANVLDVTKNQGTTLAYETPAEVKAKFDKDAELNMWDAVKKESEWAKLPKGGWLILSIGRLTIGAANTDNFSVLVTDPEGKEISRKELENNVPSPYTAGSITVWKNTGVVGIPEPMPSGSKVYVIDRLQNNRHEYLIQN